MAELQNVLGQTIVNFSRDGVFPEEDAVSAMYVQGSALSVALQAVSSAKAELEVSLQLRFAVFIYVDHLDIECSISSHVC